MWGGLHSPLLNCYSRVWLFVTPWTIACQAPLSMGFSRHDTRVGCHFLLQGIFWTWWSNLHLLCLLYWQEGSLPLAPLGSPHPPLLAVKVKKGASSQTMWVVPKTAERQKGNAISTLYMQGSNSTSNRNERRNWYSRTFATEHRLPTAWFQPSEIHVKRVTNRTVN